MSTIQDFRSAMAALLSEPRTLSADERGAVEDMLALTWPHQESVNVSSLKLSTSGRKMLPAKDRLAAVNKHLSALRAAAMDRDAFEHAIARLLADKLIRTSELIDIATAYSGRKLKAKTNRSEAEKTIRQTFARASWQEEAYRRIEKLTAAE